MPKPPKPREVREPAAETPRPVSRSAMSIPEVLTVLAIVGVLLGILIPALSATFERAERTSTLSSMRSHGQVFHTYSSANRDAWPVFIDPGPDGSILESGGYAILLRYFDMHASWNIALADGYYGGDYDADVFYPNGFRAEFPDAVLTPLTYSCAMVADPTYWDRETRLDSNVQWHGTRVGQVAFPSAKSLIVNSWPSREIQPIDDAAVRYEVSFADGSGSIVPEQDIAPGYFRGDGDPSLTDSGHMGDFPPGVHTLRGVLGRDISR